MTYEQRTLEGKCDNIMCCNTERPCAWPRQENENKNTHFMLQTKCKIHDAPCKMFFVKKNVYLYCFDNRNNGRLRCTITSNPFIYLDLCASSAKIFPIEMMMIMTMMMMMTVKKNLYCNRINFKLDYDLRLFKIYGTFILNSATLIICIHLKNKALQKKKCK